MAAFDAKTDTAAGPTVPAASDKLVFGDVSADAWETILLQDALAGLMSAAGHSVTLNSIPSVGSSPGTNAPNVVLTAPKGGNSTATSGTAGNAGKVYLKLGAGGDANTPSTNDGTGGDSGTLYIVGGIAGDGGSNGNAGNQNAPLIVKDLFTDSDSVSTYIFGSGIVTSAVTIRSTGNFTPPLSYFPGYKLDGTNDRKAVICFPNTVVNAQNSGSSETDLYSFSLPANAFLQAGNKLELVYSVKLLASGGQTKTLRFWFGGTYHGDFQLTAYNDEEVLVRVTVERNAVNTSSWRGFMQVVTATGSLYQLIASGTHDFTAATTVKLTGQSSGGTPASGDILVTTGTNTSGRATLYRSPHS